ncbi:serine/threonine-protein kinase [Novosphingobium sp.]|uniref:protein kinase domain-containing protein n=1 Tax=Novosphingobium sp. TaxID=1874826 RepID=UPI001D26E195|nr:serine/threonine-protein kinase [Novosphingobium sp.]MBX9662259.1 serine/threonine protein kinase [Novosphingobium sp.]
MSMDARALKIVEEALALDGSDRAAFVASACGPDAELAARVQALLARDDDDARLFQTESFLRPLTLVEDIPGRFGPYRVVGEIARGGMGAVVKAERDDGVFAATVAIKLIRADLGNDRARHRFEQERRILAQLRHPGIVRIIDGGAADGRPWLAMDFIDGRPITEALADAPVNARLLAFEQVCEAVAFAHRNLVIHADIKPSNVLVDTTGRVQLLDFGIARLIADLDPAEAGDPYPLTKGYAAPERAAGMAPTIASDVFSLGVLLLGLLGKDLPRDGAVYEQGTRLPVGQLEGDLRAIAARALAEQPAERYPDVPALLADVRRHRAWLPVAARAGEGRRYSAGRFIWRHRRGLALTAAAMIGLAGATVVSTTQYLRAEAARAEADRRFAELRRLADFMLVELSDRLADSPGTVPARARLATVAGGYLDRLRQVPRASADLRLDTARGYRRLASIEGLSGTASLGRPDRARAALAHADALLKTLPDGPEVAEERGWVALGYWTLMADAPPSSAKLAEGCALFDRVHRAAPTRESATLGALVCRKNEAYELIWAADRPQSAIPILQSALAEVRATRWSLAYRRDAALLEVNLLGRLGDAIYYAGDKAAALAPFEAQEALVRRWLARGTSPVWIDKLGEATFNIAGTLGELPGRSGESLKVADEGIGAVRGALAFGTDANLEKRLVILLGQKSLALADLGEKQAAAKVSGEGIAIRRRRLAGAPSDPQRRRDLAVALVNHAALLAEAGQRGAACATVREDVALWQALARDNQLGARDRSNDLPKAQEAVVRYCG